MKKVFYGITAGILGAALLFSAACNNDSDDNVNDSGDSGSSEPTYDRESPAYTNADVTINVKGEVAGQNGKISSELFGVFLEDINYASQALDDNMVINGSFQSKFQSNLSYGWKTEGATLSVVTDDGGVLGNLYRDYNGHHIGAEHAKLIVNRAEGALINTGFVPVPMAVKEGTDYIFSAFVKAGSANNMTVSVTDGTKVYAETEIPLSAGGWVKYQRTLTANDTADENLKLKLSFANSGTVYLDGVAFETTDSTVGIKNYLYNAVKELSPKFFRFPGGCIIEGENYEQAYDWKNSIGAVANESNAGDDIVPAFTYSLNTENGVQQVTTHGEAVTRKTNTNLWENNGSNYFQMEYGLGFYEYFMLCESMGATALPVVNCGLSCQGQAYPGAPLPGRHNKYIEDYIQDALDLVEFARGGEDTKWGKIRADMGHAAPFDMHYIGIGNEQWNTGNSSSNYYTTYYEKFVEAFQDAATENPALYGDIELIVGNHQQLKNCEGYVGEGATGGDARNAAIEYRTRTGKIQTLGEYGIQDHHYYNSPVDFFLNTHLYDNYTREGENRYEVFVGEYSANNFFKYSGNFDKLYQTNNWLSALSEAAMMTGFERNGDIVRLAAYAPMFANYKGVRHWAVDMMLYTNTEVVLTPNYFVQQIFMQNTGSRKLQSTLTLADGVSPTLTLSGNGGASADIDRLYYVTSLDEATGDVIVKIVNAGEDDLKVNIAVDGREITHGDYKYIWESELSKVSTLTENVGQQYGYTIGGFTNNTLGVESYGYSVTVIRVHTK